MKTTKLALLGIASFCLAGLTSCGGNSANTITIAASELPHGKILDEAIRPILKNKGFDLKISYIDWTLQNDAVAHDEYDANYFQHIPYLNTYNGTSEKLTGLVKIHYEVLCLYTSTPDTKKSLFDGASIELVNDVSNIERALQLLASYNYLTINDSNYNEKGEFANFDVANPNSCVTWAEGYKNCTLTCIKESLLPASLPDYDFGILPGNTALTGLGDKCAQDIVLSEKTTPETISAKANIIAVKKGNENTAKSQALIEAAGDASVGEYIAKTFGDSVLYHYENLLLK